MTEAESNEKKLNCEDYEEMMADSAAKRAADSKSLAQREGAKADTERALVDAESEKTSTVKELMATVEYIGQLQCNSANHAPAAELTIAVELGTRPSMP